MQIGMWNKIIIDYGERYMKEYKMLDLFHASNEEAGEVFLSELLPAVVKEYGDCLVGEGIATLASEVLGAICPIANHIRLGYKQKRLERNVNKTFEKLNDRQDEIEEKLMEMKENHREYLSNLTEMLLDQILDEIQEKKVELNVNGYINLIKSDSMNEDVALMFFKTLSQLNDLDIRVLKLYSFDSEETAYDVMSQLQISYEQLRMIKEKLERFGLLQSRNEEIHDGNLELIVKYLQAIEKERKKSKPKDIKLPNLKKVSSSDSYKMTSLGRDFLQLISV